MPRCQVDRPELPRAEAVPQVTWAPEANPYTKAMCKLNLSSVNDVGINYGRRKLLEVRLAFALANAQRMLAI